MALGSYDNNRDNQVRKPTVYSPYGASNTFSTVDPSRVAYSFWNKMLKITVTPMANKGEDGSVTWAKDDAVAAYLTHTKAQIFANEIRNFLKDPQTYNSSGIITNETLLTISNGEEFNTPGVFLVVRKIDKDNGHTLSSYSYQFNTDFYNSVRNYNEQDASFNTEFEDYSMLEVHQLLAVLDAYVESMTYAQAYAFIDATDYNYNQIMSVLDACAKGLGVSVEGRKGLSGNKSNSSVFNQRGRGNNSGRPNVGSSVQHMSAEELEEDIFG